MGKSAFSFRILFLFNCLSAICLSAISQEKSETLQEFWTLESGIGGIIAHNEQVRHQAISHPRFLDLEYSRIDPRPEWSGAYGNPKFGVALQYFDYQNAENLGSSLAGVVFLEPRLWKRISFRLGTGMVYNFSPFNLSDNHKNMMLGSRVALVMHGQMGYYQKINSNFGFRTSIGLTHFSNGAFTQPNSGINVFFASLGLFYETKKEISGDRPILPFQNSTPFQIQVSGVFSLVEKFPIGGPKFPVYGGSLRGIYRIGRKSSLSIGPDYSYNLSRVKLIKEKPSFGPREGRVGMAIGHELHISRISLWTEFGYYIWKKQTIDPNMYQRYGFRYYIQPQVFFIGLLKVHRSKAECFELGMGYTIWQRKR